MFLIYLLNFPQVLIQFYRQPWIRRRWSILVVDVLPDDPFAPLRYSFDCDSIYY
jgi:hypothetical protein